MPTRVFKNIQNLHLQFKKKKTWRLDADIPFRDRWMAEECSSEPSLTAAVGGFPKIPWSLTTSRCFPLTWDPCVSFCYSNPLHNSDFFGGGEWLPHLFFRWKWRLQLQFVAWVHHLILAPYPKSVCKSSIYVYIYFIYIYIIYNRKKNFFGDPPRKTKWRMC